MMRDNQRTEKRERETWKIDLNRDESELIGFYGVELSHHIWITNNFLLYMGAIYRI